MCCDDMGLDGRTDGRYQHNACAVLPSNRDKKSDNDACAVLPPIQCHQLLYLIYSSICCTSTVQFYEGGKLLRIETEQQKLVRLTTTSQFSKRFIIHHHHHENLARFCVAFSDLVGVDGSCGLPCCCGDSLYEKTGLHY
jgi:hypothetical protein